MCFSSRYTLIQIFSKFGKLARLDYLFHKTGALRGKPRGYAFVEYATDTVSAFSPARNERKRRKKKVEIHRAHIPGSISISPLFAPDLSSSGYVRPHVAQTRGEYSSPEHDYL
jgi:hypothetical protein